MSARELLPTYVIADLEPDELRELEEGLRADPSLAAELTAFEDAAAALCDALPPVAPDPGVRDRLFAATEGRFTRFAARFAELFDVSLERARDLLAMADHPGAWTRGPGRGISLIHFAAGPRCAGADTGFVKVAAGVTFPWHGHLGEEHSLVLHGEAVDPLAGRVGPGDETVATVGTAHDFRAVGDDLIFAVRVYGVDFSAARPLGGGVDDRGE